MSRHRDRRPLRLRARDARGMAALQEAWRLAKARDWKAAGELVAQVIEREPEGGPLLGPAHMLAALIAYDIAKVVPAFDVDGETLEPIRCAERFLEDVPHGALDHLWPDVYWLRAMVLGRQSRWDDALESAERFRALQPGRKDFAVDYGGLLSAVGRFDEALAAWSWAESTAPAIVRFNRAMVKLLLGDWEAGFRDYEARHEVESYPKDGGRHFATDYPAQRWTGQPIPGARLLVYWEQGLGDSLALWRHVRWVIDTTGAHIILETHGPLLRLAHEAFPEATIVRSEDPLPRWDWHVGLFSLPHLHGTRPGHQP